jgi:hypothetical protein
MARCQHHLTDTPYIPYPARQYLLLPAPPAAAGGQGLPPLGGGLPQHLLARAAPRAHGHRAAAHGGLRPAHAAAGAALRRARRRGGAAGRQEVRPCPDFSSQMGSWHRCEASRREASRHGWQRRTQLALWRLLSRRSKTHFRPSLCRLHSTCAVTHTLPLLVTLPPVGSAA